ncbi:SET domain-containing protein [Plasmodiophora brassicae]|uniref:SET domain-containing protein n=1 Tax=Plasmodiophora brassicae TaxID=37360 RepID=A0A0G4J3G1_PLABS|nr:hypothetical protein PBRA_002347 [Plasmodiophora brassicae]SPQ93725.1 unnamed protein product [Plasmodiophora brassicae]
MPNYRLLGHDQYGVSPFPHSCTPSAWVVGHFIELRRTVRAGDAITLDFTFFETESSLYHGRPCMCGCGAPALAFDKWRDVGLMKIARRHVGRLIAAKFKENGWHDPRIEVRHSRASGMLGLHCRGTTISAGELIAVFAGKTIHRKYMFKPGAVSSRDYEMSLQIQDELWQIPNEDGPETTDYINHSCAPSAGMKDSVSLVAIRDIVPGEEVTIDYGMVNNGLLQNASDNFVCRCRATNCRGRITTNDWQHPNVRRLQQYCSPFVQEKMSATTSIC